MNEAIYKNEYMQNLFRYIENNISANLDTALLSSIGYVSRAKLYHDFSNISGHSVKEYIRKRRLSNALALIKASDVSETTNSWSLADIAYQCGYSSQQTLCRAVKQYLGMTPLEYKDGDIYYFYRPYFTYGSYDGDPVQSVTVSSETIPEMVCLQFYHSSIKGIENKTIDTFLNAIPDYEGRIFGRNGKQDGSRFCYELYLTDTDRNYNALKSYGFIESKVTVPLTATFAYSTVENDEDKINAAWNYLYHTWLQNSMF